MPNDEYETGCLKNGAAHFVVALPNDLKVVNDFKDFKDFKDSSLAMTKTMTAGIRRLSLCLR